MERYKENKLTLPEKLWNFRFLVPKKLNRVGKKSKTHLLFPVYNFNLGFKSFRNLKLLERCKNGYFLLLSKVKVIWKGGGG